MTDVLIRGLDEPLLAALKQRAADNKRSLQQELRSILAEATEVERKREARQRFLDEVDRIRACTPEKLHPLLDSTDLIRLDRDSDHGRLFWPYD